MENIPHNKPSLGREEINGVEKVIKSGWLVQGERVREFERRLCQQIGLPSDNGVALTNGTSALYVALKVLEVGEGDEVIIPTYVCSSLLNVIYMAGAEPVLVDVGTEDFNISIEGIKKRINTKTRVVIVPHMFGVPADMIAMKKELEVPIIEDCATAIGSKIDDRWVGNFSDVAIFSFYASKMIATGQGGMLVSGNPDYVKKARDYREFDLGKGKEKGKRPYYPRFNFEMTDIQAAIGIVQLKKLPFFLEKRKKIAENYKEICALKGWDFQKPLKDNLECNYYRFVVKTGSQTKNKLKHYLKDNGVSAIIPIENWELLHNYLGLDRKNFQKAEQISNETLSLPIYPDLMKKGNLGKITNVLKRF